MASDDDSYEANREVWRKLYKQLIQENSDLDSLLEEKSLYWNDDKEVADTFVLKTIKRFDPEAKADQRSEEHTSELQSRQYLVCRLLLEKKLTSSLSSPRFSCPP